MSDDQAFSRADVNVRPMADGRWEVRRTGERYPTSHHRTRWSALKAGRLLAEESGTWLSVEGLDGSVTRERAPGLRTP